MEMREAPTVLRKWHCEQQPERTTAADLRRLLPKGCYALWILLNFAKPSRVFMSKEWSLARSQL